ncbi:DUF1671-domain-containing protein, partial [Aureobasidium melanogenum]
MECPFLCGFHTTNDHHADYQITVHIELHHTPDSHFAIEDEDLNLALALQRDEERQVFAEAKDHGSPTESSAKDLGTRKEGAAYPLDADFPYAECPQCEDFVHFVEFDEHMNNHLSLQYSSDSITNMAEFDSEHDANLRQSPIDPQGLTTIARPIDQRDKKSSQNNNATVFAAARPKGTRLGKKELGPYAFEDRMPESMLKRLRTGETTRRLNRIGRDGRILTERIVDNEVPGLIPVIARICVASSNDLQNVHLCHPSVQHVHKGTNPGHFCGYRNIQMLVSFIQSTKVRGHEHFGTELPGILQIQDMIEEAWDRDPQNLGKQETGGIRNTRKWIGTPEAASICKHLNLHHSVKSFSETKAGRAHQQLLNFVENYFSHGAEEPISNSKVHKTHRPPLFFQQPGHSMTIVGIERYSNGSRSLLVFDPSFEPPKQLADLVTRSSSATIPAKIASRLLRPYRRGAVQLARYDEFEILTLEAPALPI